MRRSILTRVAVMALTTLSTFLLGVLISRLGPTLPVQSDEPSPWQVLLSFKNQDLGGLDDESGRVLQRAVDVITGESNSDSFLRYVPRLFRTISNTSGQMRYILVEEQPLRIIPGESRLRVHVFDAAGGLLSKEDFAAGYRTILTGMKIRKLYGMNGEAIIVNGDHCFGGHPSYQHYMLVGNRIRLVYFQADGQFNPRLAMSVGPKNERSADEWEKALCSADTAEVLSALIWLRRWSEEPAPYDLDKSEAAKASNLHSRDQVRKRLAELKQSTNSWIQIAASFREE